MGKKLGNSKNVIVIFFYKTFVTSPGWHADLGVWIGARYQDGSFAWNDGRQLNYSSKTTHFVTLYICDHILMSINTTIFEYIYQGCYLSKKSYVWGLHLDYC
jgi:hypothetical protein